MEKAIKSTGCKGNVSPLNYLRTIQNSKECRAVGFVLVHAGAGYHSESKAKEYKHACKRACQKGLIRRPKVKNGSVTFFPARVFFEVKLGDITDRYTFYTDEDLCKAMEKLRDGAMAVEAVTAALVELEDSPFTNAGTGSNLNLVGDIECDASIMEGKSLDYGAVGALSGIKNPVMVARTLLNEAQKGKLSAGRVPPCFLAGIGAQQWAISHGIPPCPSEKMATKFSLSAYKRNKRKMEMAEKMEPEHNSLKRRRQSSGTQVNEMVDLEEPASLDTVGAVVVDQQGNVAAAVSSGGLAMKHPGRVGQAAQYGCGCWAENAHDARPYSTAVSTSGCGEHLMRTMLARECSTAMQADNAHQALLEAMQNKFIGSPFLASEDGVLGGIIVLRCCRCGEDHSSGNLQALLVEFLWTHTTESMCVGYMSASDRKARAHISRLPPGAVAGQSLAIEGGVCRLGV